MPSVAIRKYFDATENRKIRDDLLFAVENVEGERTAVDCGCGAGADINYLASVGFSVHGFDIEDDSVSRCALRFQDKKNVCISKSSFEDFIFPSASLVVADASLFFCAKRLFPLVWGNIYQCLIPGGIFCGSFLGVEDTMASSEYNSDDFWPEVSAFEEADVKLLFSNYQVLRFTVHMSSGVTPTGEAHDWHIFSVVAKKPIKP